MKDIVLVSAGNRTPLVKRPVKCAGCVYCVFVKHLAMWRCTATLKGLPLYDGASLCDKKTLKIK